MIITELDKILPISEAAETNRDPVEEITHGDCLLAIIIPANFSQPGIKFFTPNSLSQQLAYMNHPAGKVIQPHVHNPVSREVFYTQEVLFIRKGKLRVDFYTQDQQYIDSRLLQVGDVILLIAGGHGFEAIEDLEMIEVKQGPYVGEQDKTRFSGISAAQVNLVT
ncbi:cupin domain-containing protein [Limnofasciculus baicalensis]|uniref:Uncharacterized protein n=1 Tax=Limnofasciculus baicalensis BBK-W-15 TaxID=2699891 RepID=A0AAE3GXE4_9CYAN|nr:hypothetical protein [Limnofasciculus baicalensis]MCP2731571.1 hypothetical protein [Limnofasciculus baicalensis BBK-W-15]